MEALLNSAIAVTIAEIGDKTQLLSLLLAARFRQRHLLVLGILVATLINHGLSAWLGNWVAERIPEQVGQWLIGGSFIAVALWILIPDKDEDASSRLDKYGAFVAALVLFFLAEIGDKTQIATVILAASYQDIAWVTVGTTLGMLAANVPVIYAGGWLLNKVSFQLARWIACALFATMGIAVLVGF
jgi:putative Ca2+/H+ antiporter (TMEM165/GDT1 family)